MNRETLAWVIQESSKTIGQLMRLGFAHSERKKMQTSEEASVSVQPTVELAVQPSIKLAAAPVRQLPTREETSAALKRRLARELYKAELDLAGGLRIAGKPCDCLDVKHSLFLEACAEELIPQEPSNPVYQEIIQWVKHNQHKVSIEAIESGKYKGEYPHMASQFKEFRKRVMGTAALSDLGAAHQPVELEEAKKLAAEEAAQEVERRWHSQEKKKTNVSR